MKVAYFICSFCGTTRPTLCDAILHQERQLGLFNRKAVWILVSTNWSFYLKVLDTLNLSPNWKWIAENRLSSWKKSNISKPLTIKMKMFEKHELILLHRLKPHTIFDVVHSAIKVSIIVANFIQFHLMHLLIGTKY